MAAIKYDIISSSTDESNNYQNGMSHIQYPTQDHFWEIQNPKNQETIRIEFKESCQIREIEIRIIFCSQVKVTLFNVTEDHIEIQKKYLEAVKFLNQNQIKKIPNQDSTENNYKYADITFYSMNQKLSIMSLQVYGLSNSKQNINNQNFIGQLSSNKIPTKVGQFPLFKLANDESSILRIAQNPSNSGLKIPSNTSISQRSTQLVNKSIQMLNPQNSLFSSSKSENKSIKLSQPRHQDTELTRAIEESLRTHKKEQEQEKSKIDIESIDIQDVLDEFYDEEEKVSQHFKTDKKKNLFIDQQLQTVMEESIRSSQQKQQIKQSLFSSGSSGKNIPDKIEIEISENKQEDLDFEQMIQYNTSMIHRDFVQFHRTLEESHFRGDSLFKYMDQQFKALQGQIIYIKPDSITEYEYNRLQLKAEKLGGQVIKQITDKTTIIISDEPVNFVNKQVIIVKYTLEPPIF